MTCKNYRRALWGIGLCPSVAPAEIESEGGQA